MLPRLLTSFLPTSTKVRRRKQRPLNLLVEQLEDRLAPAGLPADLVVGRTLSAYTVPDVRNNTVAVTYTVYNQRAEDISGILLTTTLQSGVTFTTSSVQPDQSGQNLAWSLGTLPAYGRASVTVTMSLPNPQTLVLDSGATAFGTLNAGMVTADTPAAALVNRTIPSDLLASTPDANTTDPFVQEQAAKLRYDPAAIFEYLNSDVGYESYTGSLRGARGTLWSAAGNSLDEASLGVALYRASGIPARYAQGTLSDPLAKQLILTMFPASFQTVGYIPAGTAVADPANDPQLLAETRDHYWIQVDTGGGFQDADTSGLGGTAIGTVYTTVSGTFATVAAPLRHKVRVTLDAETYSQASALIGFGNGISSRTVLDQTFNSVDLVGRPLTIGHFVNTNALGGLLFSARTTTYTPYFGIGDVAYDPSYDTIIPGTTYQEMLTNFPLGSQVLTGLFVGTTLTGPDGPAERFERTLMDRIGYAARQGLAGANVSVNPNSGPAISVVDLFTINFQPGWQNTAVLFRLSQLAQRMIDEHAAEPGLIDATAFSRNLVTVNNWLNAAHFHNLSDSMNAQVQGANLVKAYFARPRITITSARATTPDGNAAGGLAYAIDLRNVHIRAIPHPGQQTDALFSFNIARGFADNMIEDTVIAALSESAPSAPPRISTSAVMDAATAQGIPLVLIDANTRAQLDALAISAEAKGRITAAVQAGRSVMVPARAVTIGGVSTVAWYDIDTTTGETIGVTEDGGHQAALVGWGAAILFAWNLLHTVTPEATGAITGALSAVIVNVGYWLCDFKNYALHVTIGTPSFSCKPAFKKLADDIVKKLDEAPQWPFNERFKKGFKWAFEAILTPMIRDPEINPLLIGAGYPVFPTANAATADVAVAANQAAGAVTAGVSATNIALSGAVTANWQSTAATTLTASSLTANGAVTDVAGNPVGTGAVSLSGSDLVPTIVGPGAAVAVAGNGSLSFYAPAGAALGVSGEWSAYMANLSGTVTVTLTTDRLRLNGNALPAGTYTITTTAATLAGSGVTSSPNFAGTATLGLTNGTVELGAGTGNLSVGGTAFDPTNGTTLAGYTGTIVIAAGGNNPDSITLNGTAGGVLRVTPPTTTPAADQNTPVTFQVNVAASLADTYTLSAVAPVGWDLAADTTGRVTARPTIGLQSGTHPIEINVVSKTNPDLVARTTVNVAVTATQPGVALTVSHDPIFTVPFAGAQLPTAFRATVQNLGPVADTFAVTVANLPAGFSLLDSGTTLTVPAGDTGILGLYLQPNAGSTLPAPGTVLTFDVTATSTTNPAITQTRSVSFTVPEVHAVAITSTPEAISTIPGQSVPATITLKSVGNVAETVSLTSTGSPGLTITGLPASVPLALGQTVQLPVTAAVAGTVPLNSNLTSTITATYGPTATRLTQTVQLPVRVVVPGADAIASAATAAGQLGNAALANRLSDLSTALTNLVQTPDNPVFRGQAVAALNTVINLADADPFLAPLVPTLQQDAAALAAATTPAAVQAAVQTLGTHLGSVGETLTAAGRSRFTLAFVRNTGVALPATPMEFGILLRNTGTQTTTYDLTALGVPASVTAAFSQSSVTLGPGQSTFTAGNPSPTLTLTPGATTDLLPFSFQVRATVQGASAITQTADGSITVRSELVSVVSVTPTPAFTNAGGQVAVSARVLNAVNRHQQASVTYVVKDAGGVTRFTSQPVPTTLTVATGLLTVPLGNLDTTGFANGDYTITVAVSDAQSQPIPGATGTGHLLVGMPVSATLTSGPETLPSGTGTVTNTLVIGGPGTSVGPLGVVSVTDLPGAGGVVKNGRYVYASGTTGIRVFDIADPANPQLIRTFGSSASTLEIRGDKLFALQWGGPFGRFTLMIYSLADPENPQFLGTARHNNVEGIPYSLAWNMVVTDTHVFVSLWSTTQLIGNPQDIKYQTGDVIAIDVSNPAAPVFVSALLNTYGTNNDGIERFLNVDVSCGDGNLWEIVQVNANTLLVAGSTARGDNTQNGSGVVHVVDISNPAQMAIVRTLTIPGTVQAVGLSIEGNRAFVTASQGGWNDPAPASDADLTGNLVLATLDISDPRTPVLIHSAVQNRSSVGPYSLHTVPLGNGLFAFSSQGNSQEQSALVVVDATNPTNLITSRTTIPAINAFGDLEGEGNFLYSTSPSGLIIYQIDAPDAIPATASVPVSTNAGVAVVPGSFSLAPTRTVPAAGGTTFEWDLSLGSTRTITWQSTVTDLKPGETRDTTTGSTVSFVSQGTAGSLALAETAVAAANIVALAPPARTVRPGEPATFTVTVANPTNAAVTYTLAVPGVPAGWVSLPATIAVAANGTATATLTLTPDGFAALADYGFAVTAVAATGARGSAQGTLTVAGAPVPVDEQARGVVVSLTPATATAGQGTSVSYVVRVTNTGSETETFNLTAAGLPAGIAAVFAQTSVVVPPGAGNFREVFLTHTPAVGTAVGNKPFTVTATSPNASASTTGTLVVVSQGVTVTLDRTTGNPGDTFQATIRNTGSASDTFDLAAAGPAGLVATLGSSGVTLGPGQSVVVPVATGAVTFAVQGNMSLTVTARSRGNTAVMDADSAALVIGPTVGLAARFDPATRTLTTPGAADFTLLVENTGNTEDVYTATITGTAGPIEAALVGLDGRPTQTIDTFRLPGLSTGAILVRTNLKAAGAGTVTVTIRSQTTPTRAVSPTANVSVSTATPRPGQDQIYAIGAGPGGGPRVQVYDAVTNAKRFDFFAYDSSLRGGVSVATADVTGDGIEDIITGAGFGGGSHVKVFNGATGALQASWFAYEPAFLGGVWVSAQDLDGDGTAEVVTGPGAGGGPLVKVWKVANGLPAVTSSFLAFEESARGGVTVACGLAPDGRAFIAAGAGAGGGPRMRVFDAASRRILSDTFVFEPGFAGGVALASGDVLGTGRGTQILVGPGAGGGPRLGVYDPSGAKLADTFAAVESLRNGLTVASLDLPARKAAVLVGAGEGAFRGDLTGGSFDTLDRVGFFEDGFDGGVFVG